MSYQSTTPNFHLPQWVYTDPPQMNDFNSAFSSIDENAVPKTRTINNKPLTENITLTSSDVGAVPSTRKVNGKPLTGDITLTAEDVGAVPESDMDYVELTAPSQFKNVKVRVSKAGRMVTVSAPRIDSWKKESSGYLTLCTLPEGFRPSTLIDMVVPTDFTYSYNLMVSPTNGNISLSVRGDVGITTNLRINFSFTI